MNNHMIQEKNILKLIIHYVRPAVIALMITGIYTIIDGIFIGRKLGPMGLSAITLAIPITTFIVGIGVLISVGSSVNLGKRVVKHEYSQGKRLINKALILLFIASVFLYVLILFKGQLMTFLGSGTNPKVVAMSETFVITLLALNPIYLLPIVFNDFLKNLGKPNSAMSAMFVGTLVNIALDYLFIIVIGMGLFGAALATCIGQFSAFIVMLIRVRKSEIWKIKLKISETLKHFKEFLTIFVSGLPSLLSQLSLVFVMLIHNRLFLFYGNDLYVSSFGLIGYSISFFWLINMGIAGGLQPILSANFSAHKKERLKKITRYGLIMFIGFAISYSLAFYIFPEQIISVFNSDPILIELTKKGIYLSMFCLPFTAFNIFNATYFQSIGMHKTSTLLTVMRGIFMIPFIFILPSIGGVMGIFLIIPLTEMFTCAIGLPIFIKMRSYKKDFPQASSDKISDI